MNAFPYLAAFTICVSVAILHASFADLREAPFGLDAIRAEERGTAARIIRLASVLRPSPATATPSAGSIDAANEGLLDHELASADPINTWLDRYLTPPTE
jgi:hypothetical protein